MSTLLLFEDDPADRDLIRRMLSTTNYALLEAETLEDCAHIVARRPIDVAVVSLAAVPNQAVPALQHLLRELPDKRIVALAPSHGDGLPTLLRAESLGAHHLLAKPVNAQQLLTILGASCPSASQ